MDIWIPWSSDVLSYFLNILKFCGLYSNSFLKFYFWVYNRIIFLFPLSSLQILQYAPPHYPLNPRPLINCYCICVCVCLYIFLNITFSVYILLLCLNEPKSFSFSVCEVKIHFLNAQIFANLQRCLCPISTVLVTCLAASWLLYLLLKLHHSALISINV